MNDPQSSQPGPKPEPNQTDSNRRIRRTKKQNEVDTATRLSEEGIAATNRIVEAGARSAVMVILYADDKFLIESHDHQDIVNAAIERAFNERFGPLVDDDED